MAEGLEAVSTHAPAPGSDAAGGQGGGDDRDADDRRRHVSNYFRLERWEIPPPPGAVGEVALAGRSPVDLNQRGPAGGMRTGGLLTVADSLGGFLAGITVLPQWIVTTNLMATVFRVAHRGPLLLQAHVLRRGKNTVVAALDVVDEGDLAAAVAHIVMTCAVLDPGAMDLTFARPHSVPMPPAAPDAPGPEEFFGIEPGGGAVTRLQFADRLRNPWGILHGGATAMLADVAACRAVEAEGPSPRGGPVAAADAVLHYLRPAKVGPLEARCQVLGGPPDRRLVRVAIHDVGADDRLVTLGSVIVVRG